jgi:hypothetical protein
VGFEPTIPVFEQTKTVHALDSAAIVIGMKRLITKISNISDSLGTGTAYKGLEQTMKE